MFDHTGTLTHCLIIIIIKPFANKQNMVVLYKPLLPVNKFFSRYLLSNVVSFPFPRLKFLYVL